MAQPRRERSTASGPAGWIVLLGLMVLALIIATASDGCGTDETSPAAQSPTPTSPTGTGSAAGVAAQQVIDQINTVLKTGGLPFVVGKSELAPASAATLDQIAVSLKDNAAVKAEVRGFTDDQGDAAKNQQLSLARAQAVVDYLVLKGGIAAGRLTANGLGETNPIAPNDTEAGRTQNRRVEFALS